MEETTRKNRSSARRRAAEAGRPAAQAPKTGKSKKLYRFQLRLLTLLFFLMLAAFTLVNLFTRDRTFSPNENRNLAQAPKISVGTLLDGSYFSGLTDYLADQFFARDMWLSVNLAENRLIGRKEAGGVFLGRDGYLLAKPETPDETAMNASAEALKAFASRYPELNMDMVLVPCAAAVMPDKLPANAPVEDQLAEISAFEKRLDGSGITGINVAPILAEHAAEQVYYRTDHHWTTRGAYYAYQAMYEDLGINRAPEYKASLASVTFEGTLASQSGSHSVKDPIEIFRGLDGAEYYTYYPDSEKQVTSLYDVEKLSEKDQYQVFFGGNHPVVEIHTVNDTGRNLLIFKDSYANSFVPYLVTSYDNIYMVDPRYYYDNAGLLISANKITDVLFLYSMNTFATDRTLADTLNSAVQENASEARDGEEEGTEDGAESGTSELSGTSAAESAVETASGEDAAGGEDNTAGEGGI